MMASETSMDVPPLIDPNFQPQVRARSYTWPSRPKQESISEVDTPPAVAEEIVDSTSRDNLTNLSSKKSTSRRNAWGNLSYADLITQAITSSPEGRLTLSQIYDWMVQNVPYFKDKGDSNSSAGWKNSIRHNLSLHSRFMRTQNEGAGKSSWWVINPDAKAGKSPRRRAYSMETKDKAFEKKRGRARKKVEALRAAMEGDGSPNGTISESCESLVDTANFLTSEFRPRTSSNASSCGRISPLRPQLLQDFDDNNTIGTSMSPISWNTGSATSLNKPFGKESGFIDMTNISEMMTLTLADSAIADPGLDEGMNDAGVNSSPNGTSPYASLNNVSPYSQNTNGFDLQQQYVTSSSYQPGQQQQQQQQHRQLPPPPPYPEQTAMRSPQQQQQQQQQPQLMMTAQQVVNSTVSQQMRSSPNRQLILLSGGQMLQLSNNSQPQNQYNIFDNDLDLEMSGSLYPSMGNNVMLSSGASQQYSDGVVTSSFSTGAIQRSPVMMTQQNCQQQSILRAALTGKQPQVPLLSSMPTMRTHLMDSPLLPDLGDFGTIDDWQDFDCDVNEVIKHELNVDGSLDCNFDSIGAQSSNDRLQ